jgi:phosphoglucomutase
LIYEKSKTITTYKRAEVSEIDLSQIQVTEGQLNDGRSWRVKVEDPCADYTTLMKTLFDFDLMKKLI